MQNIAITRFDQDPTAQGVIKPADGRWQLVLDKDGYPHLYIQCNVSDDNGKPAKGMLALDDLIDTPIRDLMDGGSFEGGIPPAEEQAAFEEWIQHKQEQGIPCPRM